MYRYIDDIIIISTDNLTWSIPVVYPCYLKLTENTLQNNIVNFLGLKLILKNHKIYIDFYDKRNDFSFFYFSIQISILFYIFLYIEIFYLIIHFVLKNLCSSCFKNHNIKKLAYAALLHGYPNLFIYSIVYH